MSPAVAKAAAVRARLWCPPNAKPDVGLHMKNGWPTKPWQPPCLWRKPHLTLLWEIKKPYIWPGNLCGEFWLPEEYQPQEPISRNVKEIIAAVSNVFGVSRIDLCSARRTANIVRPRQVAMALSKRLTLRSYSYIGRQLGNRDHTTVLHGCRKMQPHIAAVSIELGDSTCPLAWARAMKVRLGYCKKEKTHGTEEKAD